MWDFLFNSLWGWLGIAGITVVGAFAVAWFFPPFRSMALAVAASAAGAAAIYTKGNRDRAALEERRKEAAIAEAKEKYDEIDKRVDTPADVADRLRKHGF